MQVVPWIHVPGMLMKDLGNRFIQQQHKFVHRRDMTPALRHQNVRVYRGVMPLYHDAAFVAPNAMLWGNVVLGHNASVWYHTYIRNYHLGKATTVGDNAVIADRTSFMGQISVGHNSFIGVGCSLDCCEVMNDCFIAHGCVLCGGVVVEDGGVVALGTVLEKDTRVKSNEYWAGNPGRFVCNVDEVIRERTTSIMKEYRELAKAHHRAVDEHQKDSVELNEEWLKEAVAKMEARRTDVAVPVLRHVPAIAKRFMAPRVTARLPAYHVRVSTNYCRMAPWMDKALGGGVQNGNT